MSTTAPHRIAAAALATLITAVCVAMAAAAAFERAAAGSERWLITALASLIVLCLHLVPALTRRSALTATVYVGCLLVTLYGHAHFFLAASANAGAMRAAAAPAAGQQQTAALQAQLAAIAARPLATVAADHAAATAKAATAAAALARCQRAPGVTANACASAATAASAAAGRVQALGVEQQQAQRADELRTQLAALAAGADGAHAAAAVDPVDAELAALFGAKPRTVGLLMSLLQSLLAEVLAGMLWVVALGQRAPHAASATTALPTAIAGAAPAAVGNAVASKTARVAPELVAPAGLLSLLICANQWVCANPKRTAGVAPAMRDPPLFVSPC